MAEVDAFLSAHEDSLAHVRGLGGDALLALMPQPAQRALRYVLERQRLTDFASDEAIARFGHALSYTPRTRTELPAFTRGFFERELQEIALARAGMAERLRAPSASEGGDPLLMELHAKALALRSTHSPSVAPRPLETVHPGRLQPDDTLPGLRYWDDRAWARPGAAVPVAVVVSLLFAGEGEGIRAQCPFCAEPCVHTLAATDAFLAWLRAPLTEERRVWLEDIRRPAWERALNAIGQALAASEKRGGDVQVSWRLRVYGDDGVEVVPYLHKATRKGGLSAGTKVSPAKLREEADEVLTAQERRIAELAARTFSYAGRDLLTALAGHPRVVLADNPNATVKVEVGRVGLLADERGGRVVLVPALDGAPLPQLYVKRLLEERPNGPPPFLFEEAARTLTVLELPEEVRATLVALGRYGNEFPPESHAALVEKLSHLSARVPVAMPRSVVGEAVPPKTRVVLRLQVMPGGSVRCELRVRPLPETATFTPGDGARDVHVRREGKPLHARRDFAEELSQASRLREVLGERLPPPDAEGPFTFTLPSAHDGLELLAALEARVQDGDAEAPELEWVGKPLRLAGHVSPTQLKVTLEKRRDWFGANGGLHVQGERVSLAVLLDAARREEKYVPVQEHTFVELGEALRRHLRTLADHTWTSSNGLEVGPSAANALDALSREGAAVDADASWRALAERIFAARDLTPKLPRTLKAELRPYQTEGFQWLTRLGSWGAGAVLADDMGLGKTVQALAVLLDRA